MPKLSPWLLILSALVCVSPATHHAPVPPTAQALAQLPMRFEPNAGQTDPQVRYLARGRGYGVFLTTTGPVLALTSPDAPATSRAVRLKLVGGATAPSIEALDRLAGANHYYAGNDPRNWRTDVASYARVAYRGVYPGVDLVFHGRDRALEYDFVVAPGADPRAVRIAFEGAESLALDADGDLVVELAGGVLEQQRPVVYQQIDAARREVAGRWVLERDETVRFEVAAYDTSRPLVIDPVVIAWSTYLGGVAGPGKPIPSFEQVRGVAVDPATGDVLATGFTPGVGFPHPGPSPPDVSGSSDAYVIRIDATGTSVLYTTYLGGSSGDSGNAIAIDGDGNTLLTGSGSADFPVLNAAQPTPADGADAFVAKLDPSGHLSFATFLGGTSTELSSGIAVDASGRSYVTGYTRSIDFPTTDGAYDRGCGTDGACNASDTGFRATDVFVAAYTPDGALDYATYLGGEAEDYSGAITADAEGRAYVTGSTYSLRFPWIDFLPSTPPGIYRTHAFVSRLSADGAQLLDSTLFGGNGFDSATGIALDPDGNIVIAGGTDSRDFPLENPIQDALHGQVSDVFVAKLELDTPQLFFSTYLGGDEGDYINGDAATDLAIDAAGLVYITGQTSADDFPLVQPRQGDRSDWDAFVAKIDTDTPALLYATILGGDEPNFASDTGTAIAVDANGDVFVGGMTAATDFPVVHAIQPQHSPDQFDGFLTKLSFVPEQFDCDVEMGAAMYRNGERVVASRVHFANHAAFPMAARVRVSLGLPSGGERVAAEIGADANTLIPAGFAVDLAPVAITTVTPGQPRGDYALRCEIADPGTGAPYAADAASFTLE